MTMQKKLCYRHIVSTLQKNPMLHWTIHTWITYLTCSFLFFLYIAIDWRFGLTLGVWFLWILFFLNFQKNGHFRENMYILDFIQIGIKLPRLVYKTYLKNVFFSLVKINITVKIRIPEVYKVSYISNKPNYLQF